MSDWDVAGTRPKTSDKKKVYKSPVEPSGHDFNDGWKQALTLQSALVLPQDLKSSAIWFPRLLDAISTTVPAHRGSSSTEVDMLSTWFSRLSSVMGRHQLLDDALHGLALYHVGLTLGDMTVIQKSRVTYGRAAQMLSQIIGSPNPELTPEVVTATVVMSMFELLCDDTTNDGWMNHIEGAAQMINTMDPKLFESEINMLFLRAFSRNWVFAAHQKKDWSFINSSVFYRAMSEQCITFAGDCCEYSRFREQNHLLRVIRTYELLYKCKTSTERKSLLGTLVDIQAQLKEVVDNLQEFAAPVEVPASDHDNIFQTRYQYESLCHASVHVQYKSGLLMINKALNLLVPNHRNEILDDRLANDICMSIDYVIEAGFLGAATLAHDFRVLLLSLPPDKCAWIKRRLRMANAEHVQRIEFESRH